MLGGEAPAAEGLASPACSVSRALRLPLRASAPSPVVWGRGGRGQSKCSPPAASCHDSRHSPTPSLWPPCCVHSSTFPRAGPGALRPHPALMDGAAPRQGPYPCQPAPPFSEGQAATCALWAGAERDWGPESRAEGERALRPPGEAGGDPRELVPQGRTVRRSSECPPHPPPAPPGPGLRLAPCGLRPLLRQARRLGTGGASPYTGPSPPPLTCCPLPGGLVQ